MKKFLSTVLVLLFTVSLYAFTASVSGPTVKISTTGYTGEVVLLFASEVCTPSLNKKDAGYISCTYKKKGKIKKISVSGQQVTIDVVGKGMLYVKVKAKKTGTIKITMGPDSKTVNIGGTR